ncbi:MAG: P-II family nitrogen regulator [Candidatus Binataceae bacterium]
MKRIEVVMNSPALDGFRDVAAELGIMEFDVAEVRRSSPQHVGCQRLCRGQAFTVDLLERAKVEFEVFDKDAEKIVHALLAALHPDRISVFKVDQVVRPVTRNGISARSVGSSEPFGAEQESERPDLVAFGNHGLA